jgi:Cellulase (glycosyl hydrolase family 5)
MWDGPGSSVLRRLLGTGVRVRSVGLLGLAVVALLIGAAAPANGARKAPAKGKPASTFTLPKQVRGVNLSLTRAFTTGSNALSDEESAREVRSACQLGAGAVRLMVSWYKLESLARQVDEKLVSKLQSLMDQANACGIKVIFDLLGTPKWDSPQSPPDQYFGAYPGRSGPAEYGWMVSWILRRWPELYALEVWNEPNLTSYWRGTPAQYAQLVNAAVEAKRQVGSRTLILGAVLAGGSARYLQELYAAGMHGQDGISIHPYSMICGGHCTQFVDPGSRYGPFRAGIEGVHQTMLQNGDTSGIWLTEFGFASCPAQPLCVSEGVQAAWMAKSLRIAACYPYIGGLTAFTLHNAAVPSSWDGTSWTLHFGMLNADFSPKPAYGAVQQAFSQLRQMETGQTVRRVARRARRGNVKKRAANASTPASQMCQSLLGQPKSTKAKPRKRRRR